MTTAVAERGAHESSTSATRAVAGTDVVVRLEGITKRFIVRRGWREILRRPRGRRLATALDAVSLEIRRGELFGLLGENGAGKTTLFKVLATLVTPDAGSAAVCGHDVVREAPGVRRLLAPAMADERSLNWRLSARENLSLFGALHGLTGEAKRRRVQELLERTGLADTGGKMVGQFSSGMRQRLLIARALLARPQVLLLDEPTRSLDPVGARRFHEFLREEIVARQGCTVLIATHKAEEALELCDRVAILHGGRVRAVGTPEELSSRITGDRYRVWTMCPRHRAFAELAARGDIRDVVEGEYDEAGWRCVELVVPGGPRAASELLAQLAAVGVPIAAFERVRLPLAELIERSTMGGAGGGTHA